MKQIITLIITVAILITFGCLEMSYLEKTSSYISSDLTYVRNGIINSDFELANNHMKQVEKTWNDMKQMWEMLIDHVEIDQIEDAMESFKVYVSNEEKAEAFVQYEILVRTFNHILESKRIMIENII